MGVPFVQPRWGIHEQVHIGKFDPYTSLLNEHGAFTKTFVLGAGTAIKGTALVSLPGGLIHEISISATSYNLPPINPIPFTSHFLSPFFLSIHLGIDILARLALPSESFIALIDSRWMYGNNTYGDGTLL